jgi:hypothetical protein
MGEMLYDGYTHILSEGDRGYNARLEARIAPFQQIIAELNSMRMTIRIIQSQRVRKRLI